MGKLSELGQALVKLNELKFLELVDEKLKKKEDPLEIIKECNDGMIAVGNLFSEKKYFISELMFSAELFKEAMKRLEPFLGNNRTEEQTGEIVIMGTVEGDIHDIGKNIAINLIEGSGYKVIDLGVDVPAARFVEELKNTGARALGLSAMLNFVFPEMKNVVDSITEAGLREQVKIIIGGAPCNEQVREYCGADYYAKDASAGVTICKEIYNNKDK